MTLNLLHFFSLLRPTRLPRREYFLFRAAEFFKEGIERLPLRARCEVEVGERPLLGRTRGLANPPFHVETTFAPATHACGGGYRLGACSHEILTSPPPFPGVSVTWEGGVFPIPDEDVTGTGTGTTSAVPWLSDALGIT